METVQVLNKGQPQDLLQCTPWEQKNVAKIRYKQMLQTTTYVLLANNATLV